MLGTSSLGYLTETCRVIWLNWAETQRLTLVYGMYFLVTDCFLNKLGNRFFTETNDLLRSS